MGMTSLESSARMQLEPCAAYQQELSYGAAGSSTSLACILGSQHVVASTYPSSSMPWRNSNSNPNKRVRHGTDQLQAAASSASSASSNFLPGGSKNPGGGAGRPNPHCHRPSREIPSGFGSFHGLSM